jgi:hypothetical protein
MEMDMSHGLMIAMRTTTCMKKPARKTTKRLGPTNYITNNMACSHQMVQLFNSQGSMELPHISFHYMPAIVTHLLNHKRTTNPKVVC